MTRARALIEDWLPIREVSVESQRERGASSALPPLYFLHVWWARRPLIASRSAVLGSVLPAWSDEWPAQLLQLFPTERDYRMWFVQLLGIRGDPVAARAKVRAALERGDRIPNPYEGARAFTLGPDAEQLQVLKALFSYRWGTEMPTVLDPTAGGGSIPFEAIRFGLPTVANEINPVASLILHTTLSLPARFGPDLANDIAYWGNIWADRVESRLKPFFPHESGESIRTYLFARTVNCPETGKLVPLSPNWWLIRNKAKVAARLLVDNNYDECQFEIVKADRADFDPGIGTLIRGKARSPWTGTVIPREYIWKAAQSSQMGTRLYAVALKDGRDWKFRQPNLTDHEGLKSAELRIQNQIIDWKQRNLIPDEPILPGTKTADPIRYGMSEWSSLFSPRQLLSLGTAVAELRTLELELQETLSYTRASAITTYLAIAVDKAADRNSLLSSWIPQRTVIRSVFDRHDLSFKWSFVEPYHILPWCVSQVVNSYRGIAELIDPSREILFPAHPDRAVDLVELSQGNASNLALENDSIHSVVIDPPYYDNVQYAELSDFFYVWLKRTAGHLYPECFDADLTDKATEAVANPARFMEFDKRNAKELARQDYEAKMTHVFAESYRVLRDDGVLTVMFNHKKVEAWDALGQSLIEGGFEILTSWPVHTESEHSLHQARKAAAASTILLTCHKRSSEAGPVWWDDLKDEVCRVARDKAKEYTEAGIQGVDLYIATFGPVLSIISRQWPVLTSEVNPDTGEPLRLRPEDALDLARQEVADLRLRGLALGRPVEFDPVTDWYLLAWDAFPAVEFPYDEARKLAFAVGIDVDGDLRRIRMLAKKGASVVFQDPKERRVRYADPEEDTFAHMIDAAHALMNAWREDGIAGAEAFLKRTRLKADARFQSLLQALLNVIPRTKKGSMFIRPEAAALDAVTVLFPDLKVPEVSRPVSQPVQGSLNLTATGG